MGEGGNVPLAAAEVDGGEVEKQGSNRVPSCITQLVLMSLALIEGADNALMTSSLAQILPDLSMNMENITTMSVFQGFFLNAAAPFWGVCADRGIGSQKMLLVVAAVGQGLCTLALTFQTGFGWQMVFVRSINGIFLAGLRPIANGIVAKTTSMSSQGMVFGRIQMFLLGGGSISTFITGTYQSVPVDMSWFEIFGWQPFPTIINGWRVAWFCVGSLSLLIALFTAVALETVHVERQGDESIFEAVLEEFKLFGDYICKPTFFIMVMQGFFGTIPWTVLWYSQRFYQMCGQSDSAAAALASLQGLFGIPGVAIGGLIGDRLFVKYVGHGRPLTAQITVMLGIPCIYILLVAMPPPFIGTGAGWWCCLLCLAGFGITGSWAQTGANYPILAAIVPVSVASRVMATESAVENTLANMFGPIAITLISENVFKFELSSVDAGEVNYDAAARFGAALSICVCGPWLCAYIVYSCLHYSVPRDFARAQAAEAAIQVQRLQRGDPTLRQEAEVLNFVSRMSKSGSRLHL